MRIRNSTFVSRLLGLGRHLLAGNRKTSSRVSHNLFACRGCRLLIPACWALACFFLAPLLAAGAAEETSPPTARWSKEKAWAWYKARPWLFGVNYGPTDEATDDRELGWAEAIGVNSIRTFFSYLAWEHDPERFMRDFEAFLAVADKHGISVMPVLFNDCAGAAVIFIPNVKRTQRSPDEIAMREICADPVRWPRLRAYVRDVMDKHRADRRIVMWDLYNEPDNTLHLARCRGDDGRCLLEHIFTWAREARPTQPLTAGVWKRYRRPDECGRVAFANSDVVTFHLYSNSRRLETVIRSLQGEGYPLVCTEWFARALGSSFENDLPVFKRHNVGNYFFGLVHDGRGTFIYPWPHLDWPGKAEGKLHPTGWFHNIFHPDGTPYRQSEIEAIKRIVKGN